MLGVKRTDGNLMFLYAVYLASLSVANVLDNSYVFIFGHTLPASVLTYPITLLVANVVRELWEEKYASRVVLLGLSVKFVGIVLLGLSRLLNVIPDYGMRWELWRILGTSFWEVSEQWVLGRDFRFWTVSIISFPIAQFVNVWLFDLLLARHIRQTGSPWGGRWSRFLTAAMAGEATEVLLFLVLAFAPNWEGIWRFTCQQMEVRTVFTLFSLPVFYALTWRRRGHARTSGK